MCLLCLICICALASAVQGAPSTFFYNPPPPSTGSLYVQNPVYVLDSHVTIKWTTNLTDYSIIMWQQDPVTQLASVGDSIYSKHLRCWYKRVRRLLPVC